jgi:hypothetical protein
MSGCRHWFAEQGLSWGDFLEFGLPLSQVEKIDDGFSKQVCDVAKAEFAATKKMKDV